MGDLVLSPDTAKLSSQKIAQETNHRWHSPLCSNEDVTRPVIEVGGGIHFIAFHLCFSSFCLNLSCVPTPKKVVPITPDRKQDLMHFD